MGGHQIEQGFVEEPWPVVVAHRGASLEHAENTLEAYEAAIDAGADVVELDVRLSADGIPVISHNASLAATTGESGFVHERTVIELKRLDASVIHRRAGTAGGDERAEIPTLAEALEVLSGRAGIDIEIKNIPGEPDFDSPREAVADKVVSALDGFDFQGLVLVSSFNWLSIERVKEVNPDIRTGFLSTKDIDPGAALVYARGKGHEFVLPQVEALLPVSAAFVEEAHASGVKVGTWTSDDPAVIEQLFSWGVDAVATNDPRAAVPIRDRFRPR
jgi:glycerophosphoryl diester phosphodiesterase